jgi:hypothetical protein
MALASQGPGKVEALPLASPFNQQFMHYEGNIHGLTAESLRYIRIYIYYIKRKILIEYQLSPLDHFANLKRANGKLRGL